MKLHYWGLLSLLAIVTIGCGESIEEVQEEPAEMTTEEVQTEEALAEEMENQPED